MALTDERTIDALFGWHEPTPDQRRKCVLIRTALRDAAKVVVAQTPESGDRSVAIRKLREAMHAAVSAVVVNTGEVRETPRRRAAG